MQLSVSVGKIELYKRMDEIFKLREVKYQVELLANLDKLLSASSIFVIVSRIKDLLGFQVEVFAIVPN